MNIRPLIVSIPLLLSHTALFAFNVPLDLSNGSWQSLNYQNIPANNVTQLESGLKISVEASASPLIYLFDQAQTIQDVVVRGTMGDLPNIPAEDNQGDIGADDFPFRLGLVLSGDKTLSFGQKLISPEWVKTLFSLAPQGTGIDQVMFLNLTNPEPIDWDMREHPFSNGLFKEIIAGHVNADESFVMRYQLPQEREVLGLWISADGDDTNSAFSLELSEIMLN